MDLDQHMLVLGMVAYMNIEIVDPSVYIFPYYTKKK
jgi:hypothetical protein